MWRGNSQRKPWALTPEDIKILAAWAKKQARRKRPSEIVPPIAPVKRWKAVTVPPGSTGGPLRRKATTLPKASRDAIETDYAHTLPPDAKAFLDQFDREEYLNRWYDREGVAPFYPRGSEERRQRQFEYNRRAADIYGHKDSFPVDIDRGSAGHGRSTDAPANQKVLWDTIPSSAPTEDDLIAAIDRSNE